MTGPLDGVRVIELGGVGPGQHAAMMLADLGADVVRIERPAGGLIFRKDVARDPMLRGRRSVSADLRDPALLEDVRRLLGTADVVLDGFRPGVTDRLGIGPASLAADNPSLVYVHMTGWGLTGPWSRVAGHDINYISVTGVLNAIRTDDARPTVPLNLVGDFGGGSLYAVVGIVAALYEREKSGRGQVVDAAIVDGVSHLAQSMWSSLAQGTWEDAPASNLLDSGCPFYDTYRCLDGRYVAVGSLEPQFFALLLELLGIAADEVGEQYDRSRWPELRERLTRTFASRTRDEWASTFEGTDACVSPVLTFGEAVLHPHLAERGTLPTVDGVTQAAPTPRFSRSEQTMRPPPPGKGSTPLGEVLDEWSA